MAQDVARQDYIADFSLALVNRTGAYQVCHDILAALPEFFAETRYWRSTLKREPTGLRRGLSARLMMLELTRRSPDSIVRFEGRGNDRPIVFLDPLYVIGSRLTRADIVLCHDVGPVSDPDLFDPATVRLYRQAYARIAAARPGMVFVSQASLSEFRSRYGEDFRFLKVIPLYVRSGSETGEAIRPVQVRLPFLLTVGGLEIRKNYPRIIEAFGASGLRERGYSYVFCGPAGNDSTRIQALARATDGVQCLGFLSDAEMRWLYRNASGFLLPSLLEGFGLPALEAARHGVLALISDRGAQPEVIGEGALTVDPTNVTAMSGAIRRLVDMPSEEHTARLVLARRQAASLSFSRYVSDWSTMLMQSRLVS